MRKQLTLATSLFLMFVMMSTATWAQKQITGTVYLDGKPAAGVNVTANKSSSTFFTSFDGKYELEISEKSKYISFEYPTEVYKLDIEGSSEVVFDYVVGKKPAAAGDVGAQDMRTKEELIAAKDKDYIRQYSLFYQYYKQKDYESAIVEWKKLAAKYPKSAVSLYVQGVKIYKGLATSAKSPEEVQQYQDKMLAVFDDRAKNFGKSGRVIGQKAIALLELGLADENITDETRVKVYKRAYTFLDKSWAESGDDVPAAVVVEYMKATVALFKGGEFEADNVVGAYDKCLGFCETKLSSTPDDANLKNIQLAVNQLFERSGAADCDALIAIYGAKFDADPNNIELISKMMRQLSRNECKDSPLYVKGAEKQYELEPSAEAAVQMAQLFVKSDDSDRAKKYYEEAISLANGDKDLLSNSYVALSAICLKSDNNYAKARDYARKAITARPDWGKGYMMVGNIYQMAAPRFSSDSMDKSALYWLAADYFNRAASRDAEYSQEARKRAGALRSQFPSKEDLFLQKNMATGVSYAVGGWVGETTTTRSRD